MPQYSEQDLRYAAELREEIHREALAIVRRTRPDVTEVVDRHPVEDYFQEYWDYPGAWYTVVAIPPGYKSRRALIDTLVRDTLRSAETPAQAEPFPLLAEYPACVVDCRIVRPEPLLRGREAHHAALCAAWESLRKGGEDWRGDPSLAWGAPIPAESLFSSQVREGELNFRRAFLCPPHPQGYTGKDFARVNAALFPNGTDALEAYRWTTDWSDYFDDGHEWWGTLCVTVYDGSLGRFVVLLASATD